MCGIIGYIGKEDALRSEEHTSELQSPCISYAVFCLKKKKKLLARREVKHMRTQAYRPRTNGKVERFNKTMARECGYDMSYRIHRPRNRAPAKLTRLLQ